MKILLFDIETAPKKAFIWGVWDQNIPLNMIISERFMLCWAAKWLDSDEIMFDRIKNPKSENDKQIVKSLHTLIDEADIVVAHYGDKFDIPVSNTCFLKHDLEPPAPYKTIDTKKVAKRYFSFTSNKLDYLGEYLGLGNKTPHTGFKLWEDCLQNKNDAWELMEKYNKQDVLLLEKVYLKLRPWIKNHPNTMADEESGEPSCPTCGHDKFRNKGYYYTNTGAKYRRWKCKHCGSNFRGSINLANKENRLSLQRPI